MPVALAPSTLNSTFSASRVTPSVRDIQWGASATAHPRLLVAGVSTFALADGEGDHSSAEGSESQRVARARRRELLREERQFQRQLQQLAQQQSAAPPVLPQPTPATTATMSTPCRLPSFWQQSPAGWFVTVESAFNVAGVTGDRTKHNLVVSALDATSVSDLLDVLSHPPDTDLYPNLKRAILARFVDSEDKQLDQLFNRLELGDRKPSQLLRSMKTLASNKVADEVLKVKWLHLLPPQVSRILKALQSTVDLDALSTVADELLDTQPGVFAVTQAARPSPSGSPALSDSALSSLSSADQGLAQQVAALTFQVSQLMAMVQQQTRRPRDRSRSRGGPRSRSTTPTGGSRAPTCWYHRTFGEKAQHCRPPCRYQPAQGN